MRLITYVYYKSLILVTNLFIISNIRLFWILTCPSNSPFQMKVKPAVEPKNVKLSGPGLQNQVPASIPVEFTIDTREAGKAEPEVSVKVYL